MKVRYRMKEKRGVQELDVTAEEEGHDALDAFPKYEVDLLSKMSSPDDFFFRLRSYDSKMMTYVEDWAGEGLCRVCHRNKEDTLVQPASWESAATFLCRLGAGWVQLYRGYPPRDPGEGGSRIPTTDERELWPGEQAAVPLAVYLRLPRPHETVVYGSRGHHCGAAIDGRTDDGSVKHSSMWRGRPLGD